MRVPFDFGLGIGDLGVRGPVRALNQGDSSPDARGASRTLAYRVADRTSALRAARSRGSSPCALEVKLSPFPLEPRERGKGVGGMEVPGRSAGPRRVLDHRFGTPTRVRIRSRSLPLLRCAKKGEGPR